jgi:hypothetical protein
MVRHALGNTWASSACQSQFSSQEAWCAHDSSRSSDTPTTSGNARGPGKPFASETDAAVLRVILKVRDGAGEDYWWVECGVCDNPWQVLYYAESVG